MEKDGEQSLSKAGNLTHVIFQSGSDRKRMNKTNAKGFGEWNSIREVISGRNAKLSKF